MALYDAAVIGLGPAGSTAAYALAKAGLRVAAFDKEAFPRYKSCGGCVSTKIENTLGFNITEVVEETIYGATFTYKSGRGMDIMSERPVGYNVMRDRFDHLLVKKAAEAGAEIRERERVRSISDEGGFVRVVTDAGQIEARFVVGADGASGFTGREHFGLKPKECAVSITAEVPYDRKTAGYDKRLFIDFGGVPYGYAWIFPKDQYLSVGLAVDAAKAGGTVKEYFESFIKTHEALKNIEITERTGWTVPIYYNTAPKMHKGRVLLAGDTGHLVDPFLGEGIYYAVRTAKSAASVIIDCMATGRADLSEYQSWLEREIYPEFRAAEKLSDIVYTHPRLWYSILEKDKDLMEKFYDVIRGERTCESFYNWVYSKISSKPWQLLRRWVESRFIPA